MNYFVRVINKGGKYSRIELFHIALKGKRTPFIFKSGNFCVDWYYASKKVIENNGYLVYSSSVDHYLMDNENIRIMYLDCTTKSPVLTHKYVDHAFEFFIDSPAVKTWSDLKKYCKNHGKRSIILPKL